MIICITDWFDIFERGVRTGKREFVVSHGIDELGRTVILPCMHPERLGATYDPDMGEWVLEDNASSTE